MANFTGTKLDWVIFDEASGVKWSDWMDSVTPLISSKSLELPKFEPPTFIPPDRLTTSEVRTKSITDTSSKDRKNPLKTVTAARKVTPIENEETAKINSMLGKIKAAFNLNARETDKASEEMKRLVVSSRRFGKSAASIDAMTKVMEVRNPCSEISLGSTISHEDMLDAMRHMTRVMSEKKPLMEEYGRDWGTTVTTGPSYTWYDDDISQSAADAAWVEPRPKREDPPEPEPDRGDLWGTW